MIEAQVFYHQSGMERIELPAVPRVADFIRDGSDNNRAFVDNLHQYMVDCLSSRGGNVVGGYAMRTCFFVFLLILLISPVNAEVRTWTNIEGKQITEAEFLGYKDGMVSLRKTDTNESISIPIDTLSFKDQWHVKREIAPKKIQGYLDKIEAYLDKIKEDHVNQVNEIKKTLDNCDARIAELEKVTKNPAAELQKRIKSGQVRADDIKKRRSEEIKNIKKDALNEINSYKEKRNELENRLKELENRLKELDSSKVQTKMPSLSPRLFQLGQIGIFEPYDCTVRVNQVIGEREMIVINVMGNGKLMSERLSKTFLIRGMPTKDVGDGSLLHLTQFFAITDTYHYETITGGTNTIFVLEPIDIMPYLPSMWQIEGRKIPSEKLTFDDMMAVKGELSVGQSGILKRAHVLQIVGDKEMLITTGYPDGRTSEPLLLRGVSSQGIVDDAKIGLPQTLKITGTDQYQATDGSVRTVFVLEPIDKKPSDASEENK